MTSVGSDRFSLSKTDLWKILKGLGISILGAILTYIVNVVIPDLQTHPGVNVTLMAVLTTAINAAIKWLSDTQQTVLRKDE